MGYVISEGGITVQPEKVTEIIDKIHNEPNCKKREKTANGFKAYYRSPLLLPICQATIEYLNEYGGKDEIRIFNDFINGRQETLPFYSDL